MSNRSMPQARTRSLREAFTFALVVEIAGVGAAYAIGGVPVAVAATLVGPVILAPIVLQMMRPTRLSLAVGDGSAELRRPLSYWVSLFLVGALLGVFGADVPGHPQATWRYLVVCLSGVLWMGIGLAVIRPHTD